MTVYRDLVRVNGDSPVRLPYPQAKIPAHEWISYAPINTVFAQLWENYKYIIDSSAIYNVAPKLYWGWGNILETVRGGGQLTWYGNNFTPQSIAVNSNAGAITDICTLINTDEITGADDEYRNIYIGRTDRVEQYNFDEPDKNVIADTSAAIESLTPTRVTSIAVDSRNQVFVLDARRHLIKVYAYNETFQDYAPVFEWGGLGGVTGNAKFYKPNDMFIANNRVFVVDSGNNCVKRFSLGGQWEYTYTSSDMSGGDIDDNAPISAALDINNDLHVVTKDNIIKFNFDGEQQFVKSIQMKNADPVRIRHYVGFLYILTKDDIIRVSASGQSTNTFATRADKSSALKEYKALHIDMFGNLYATDGTIILKYNDSPLLLEAIPKTATIGWTFDEMKVHPDEFVSPLTYNKFFHRMYDNLFMLYSAIQKKIIITPTNSLSAVPLEDCDYPALEGLIIEKRDIFIGLNEIVTPEVMNRCIKQILILQQYIVDVLLNKYSACVTGIPDSFKNPPVDLPDCCWSWEARRSILCCQTWAALQDQLCTTWAEATGCCVSL